MTKRPTKRPKHNLSIPYIEAQYEKYADKPITVNQFNKITEKIASKYYSKVNPFTEAFEFYKATQPGIYHPFLWSFRHLDLEYLYDNGYKDDDVINDEVMVFDVIYLYPGEEVISVYCTFNESNNKIIIKSCCMES